jgi:Secretion system C-terminal sorting domain
MKKVLLLASIFLAAICRSSAYTTVIVKDSISADAHWTCDKQYQLQGYVYVTAGATLTIDPGVIIRGDKDTKGALIIERGAKIKAMGTVTSPIVFTSNQPAGTRTYGDWGGVILCGKSPVNWNAGQAQVEGGPRSFYGGTDPADNSGEMHYVRIEFAGIAFSPNNEVNGLTFCGVGSGTSIDHIQVSYSGDDAIEWFGGTVNAKYLVTFRTWDDDFDTDCGYQGKNQFCAAIRDNLGDQSGSKGFESDSYQSGTYSGIPWDPTKITKPIFSNCTVIGPVVNPGSTTTDPNFVSAAHIRRGSSISILNSVIAGWPAGLLIDESSASYGSTVSNTTGELQFRNNIVCGISNIGGFNKDAVFVKDGARSLTPTTANGDTTATGTDWSVLSGAPNLGPQSFLRNPAYGNKTYSTEQSSVFLGNPFNLSNPNLVPNSTSPICYSSTHFTSWGTGVNDVFNPLAPISYDTTSPATYNVPGVPPNFTTTKANDSWFTVTNYIGAFAGTGATSDNWMRGWCEFDPNNAFYDTICYVAPPVDTSHTAVHNVASSVNNDKVYPNPTNGKATLQLEFTSMTIAKVIVMDMTGKEVKEIFNGKVGSGIQLFNFDTNDLASGTYIISINAEKKQKALRFTVTK